MAHWTLKMWPILPGFTHLPKLMARVCVNLYTGGYRFQAKPTKKTCSGPAEATRRAPWPHWWAKFRGRIVGSADEKSPGRQILVHFSCLLYCPNHPWFRATQFWPIHAIPKTSRPAPKMGGYSPKHVVDFLKLVKVFGFSDKTPCIEFQGDSFLLKFIVWRNKAWLIEP